jgi:hypothetical protein
MEKSQAEMGLGTSLCPLQGLPLARTAPLRQRHTPEVVMFTVTQPQVLKATAICFHLPFTLGDIPLIISQLDR